MARCWKWPAHITGKIAIFYNRYLSWMKRTLIYERALFSHCLCTFASRILKRFKMVSSDNFKTTETGYFPTIRSVNLSDPSRPVVPFFRFLLP